MLERLKESSELAETIEQLLLSYEGLVCKKLTPESKERIITTLALLVEDGTYYPQGFRAFKIRGSGQNAIVFHANKESTVIKIPVQWENGAELNLEKVKHELYNHESFYFGLWGLYKKYDSYEKSFRIPAIYKIDKLRNLYDNGIIIMNEIHGRSIYFFGLIQYLIENRVEDFQVQFPGGFDDYMSIKDEVELGNRFGITDIVSTLEKWLETKNQSLDYESLSEELFGVELRNSIMNFLLTLRENGLEHGDIHPGNILIEMSNKGGDVNPGTIWLIDFGKSSFLAKGFTCMKNGEEYWKERAGFIPN